MKVSYSSSQIGTMTLENGKVLAEIPSRHKHAPSYFHSFGITRDFVIFIEQPLFVQDENRNGCGGESGSLHNSLKWRKTEMVSTYGNTLLSHDLKCS